MDGRLDEPIADRAYDEAIPVETDDEEVSTPGSSEAGSPAGAKAGPPGQGLATQKAAGGKAGNDDSDSESGSSSSEGSSTSESSGPGNENSKGGAPPMGAYNPDDYKNLRVSDEIQELFDYIGRYKPHSIDLDAPLKPFIPEFVPSIGEVDAFLKIPRPDGQSSGLGSVQLDEPCLNPSDPSILDLQLRNLSKNQDLQPLEVWSIDNAEKNTKGIENWVKRIEDLARTKPPATVQYSRRMPDFDDLMQVWNGDFEEYLQQNPLPDMADLDLDLKDYIRVIASILDVPVYAGSMTETLHVIFTVYSDFKTNQHFSKTETLGGMNNDPYNFSNVGNFSHAAGNAQAVGAASQFGGPTSESMAPSRAPSPVGQARK